MHRFNKRKQPEEIDLGFYKRTHIVPLAWQVYGKHRLGNFWFPVSQQRQSKEYAESDMKLLKYATKLPPLIFAKELKILQVPASESEMEQRELFKKLHLKGLKKGAIESVYGTLTELKCYGAFPFLK